MAKEQAKKEKTIKEPKAKPEKPVKELMPPKIRNLRVMAFWRNLLIIIFVFLAVMGVWAIVRGDRVPMLRAEMKAMASSMRSNTNVHTEVEAFAQNFVRDYFTYKSRQSEDYKLRLESYCTSRLAGEISESVSLKDNSKVEYVQAINTSEYGKNQYDIMVKADILYTKSEKQPINTLEQQPSSSLPQIQESEGKSTIYLIVPVYSNGSGACVVEDMPMVIAAPKATEYERRDYAGYYADENDKSAAQQMLNDFFKTWYTETQNQINYYLSDDANAEKFAALGEESGMVYQRIENLALYKTPTSGEYTAIVSIKISDANGTEYRQRFNLQLVKKDKFYAKNIDARTYNLKN